MTEPITITLAEALAIANATRHPDTVPAVVAKMLAAEVERWQEFRRRVAVTDDEAIQQLERLRTELDDRVAVVSAIPVANEQQALALGLAIEAMLNCSSLRLLVKSQRDEAERLRERVFALQLQVESQRDEIEQGIAGYRDHLQKKLDEVRALVQGYLAGTEVVTENGPGTKDITTTIVNQILTILGD